MLHFLTGYIVKVICGLCYNSWSNTRQNSSSSLWQRLLTPPDRVLFYCISRRRHPYSNHIQQPPISSIRHHFLLHLVSSDHSITAMVLHHSLLIFLLHHTCQISDTHLRRCTAICLQTSMMKATMEGKWAYMCLGCLDFDLGLQWKPSV